MLTEGETGYVPETERSIAAKIDAAKAKRRPRRTEAEPAEAPPEPVADGTPTGGPVDEARKVTMSAAEIQATFPKRPRTVVPSGGRVQRGVVLWTSSPFAGRPRGR